MRAAVGSDVALACRSEDGVLRKGFDPMIRGILNSELLRTGIHLIRGVEVTAVTRSSAGGSGSGSSDDLLTATLSSGETLKGLDCVVMAIGRSPVTDTELGLASAGGIQLDRRGRIVVDRKQNCLGGVAATYCVGDASSSG